MKITKKFLEEQIVVFKGQEDTIRANLNATLGAIQLCEHLIGVLKKKKLPEEEIPELSDILPEGAEIIEPTKPEANNGKAKK